MKRKDSERLKAIQLRKDGWTLSKISKEINCSKSSVSMWVRELSNTFADSVPKVGKKAKFCKHCLTILSGRKSGNKFCDKLCESHFLLKNKTPPIIA
jgi:transposase